jgi:acetophenone carboxylase
LQRDADIGGVNMAIAPYMDRISRYKPEPPTQRELECAKKVNPVKLSILGHKLEMIGMEGKEVIIRTGATNMCTGTDLNAGIYTAAGDAVMCASGVWIHAFGPQTTIKFILAAYSQNPGIKDGDFWFMSDPKFGTIHNSDMYTIMPVFYKRELIAWVAAVIHENETGSAVVGAATTVKNKYEDGMYISPVKMGENFQINDAVLDMLANMTRDPRGLTLDCRTRWASCERMRRRIVELAEKDGVDLLIGGFRRLIDEAAEHSRKKIASWPDGTYRDVVFLDKLSAEDGLRREAMTVRKKGDKLTVDFTGTSPEAPGPYNAYAHAPSMMSAGYLYSYAFHDIVANSGAFSHIDYVVPPGTVLSADPGGPQNPYPVATYGGNPVGFRVICLFSRVFGKMLFMTTHRDVVMASQTGPVVGVGGGGMDQWGAVSSGSSMEFNAQGGGALPDKDGMDGKNAIWATLTDSEDVEYHERNFPWLYVFRNRAINNHGYGKYRGGTGLESAISIYNSAYWVMSNGVEGISFPCAPGLFGGYSACANRVLGIRDSKLFEQLKAGKITIPQNIYSLAKERPIEGEYFVPPGANQEMAPQGFMLSAVSGGGGGYGDVLERDADAVMRDLKEQLISHWVAENVYLVSYNPETLQVDYQRTSELRQAEREARKKRGKPFAEFNKEWLAKRPPERWMTYFGSMDWPGALV